jgi:hypothetical protein
VKGKARLEGVEPLDEDMLLTLPASELRELPFDGLLELMTRLGLSTEGIEKRSAAVTRLMQNAVATEIQA